MPRVSIYVPDDMKSEMDGIGENVNWSASAQWAFALEIKRAKWPEEPTMEDVIKRLSASKSEFVAAQEAEGFERGRQWAMEDAEYPELLGISDLDLSYDYEWPLWKVIDQAIGRDPSFREDSFWVDDEERPSEEYAKGFVRGAKDVWLKVVDKLDVNQAFATNPQDSPAKLVAIDPNS